jgi:hypothetical protein
MRQVTRQPVPGIVVLLVLLGSPTHADSLSLKRTTPAKDFDFTRGGPPVELVIAAAVQVSSPDGDQVALAVHDQLDRPLMTQPEPLQRVQQGRNSLVFKPTIQSLGPDVTEVVVEAVLVNAIKRGGPKTMGESKTAKLSYKVK